MKITIVDKNPGEDDEIIVKCDALDESILGLINSFKTGIHKLSLYRQSQIVLVEPSEIFYFESVEDRVFAYTENQVYETKQKLYQLEKEMNADFIRANKAVIVNINKIDNLAPAFGGRFEANLKNECKVIFSRMYVPLLKERLGL